MPTREKRRENDGFQKPQRQTPPAATRWMVAPGGRFVFHIAAVLGIAFPFYPLISAPSASSDANKGGRVIYSLRGHAFTCKELTGVSYAEGLERIQRFRGTYLEKPPSSIYDRSKSELSVFDGHFEKKPGQTPFETYYQHLLHGVVGLAVCSEAYHLARRRFPVKTVFPYDRSRISEYLKVRLKPLAVWQKNCIRYAKGDMSSIDYYLSVADPNNRVPDSELPELGQQYDKLRKRDAWSLPFLITERDCIPFSVDNKPPYWSYLSFDASLLRRHLFTLYRMNREKYINRYAGDIRFETCPYLKVLLLCFRNVSKESLPRFEAAVSKLIDGNGCVADAGLHRLMNKFAASHTRAEFTM